MSDLDSETAPVATVRCRYLCDCGRRCFRGETHPGADHACENHAPTGTTQYERVTYRPEGGRARSIFLHKPTVSDIFVTGIEVNREGDAIAGKGFDERRHIIDKSLVLKRVPMVMDRIYGELVPEGEQTTFPSETAADSTSGATASEGSDE